jgi:hypothetical protein
MKIIQITACLALFGTAALADSDPKYSDPAVILSDLRDLQQDCDAMEPGQSNTEIFGITFTRTDDTCQFANGELDDGVRIFLHEQNLDWVGIDGEHGLWVKATGSPD